MAEILREHSDSLEVSAFFPYAKDKSIEATSKAGIRCGRPEVRIEREEVKNANGKQSLIVHCYGHGGTGYSASWGSAEEVVKHCMSFTPSIKPTLR
ncbi:FAD-dependent oxidoreductase [Rickettsiella endosymbiont of Dermanyssus gallinae]|uniref:FAD-dependent oxidoreductase n=1 Tax=Rickettsiella endosymbiont of Dermanyssus gallinae TaxID=2856608 RepID=UPI001C52EF11|nr:FAD-dependent oxidoreductase [Rickettsiella endosymbiont of Dermanyssus gallinae]